jgi:hypothetical protein
MGQDNKELLSIEKIAQNLSTFAIDRTELKQLLEAIPADTPLNLTTFEYELQLLKILSVGWAISFFMPAEDKHKGPLAELFWGHIRDISNNISMLTQTTSGAKVDYFEILKTRLDTYLDVMKNSPDEAGNPAGIIGPVFASVCNSENDAVAILAGTKMFTLTLGAVKEYLNAVKIDDIKLN